MLLKMNKLKNKLLAFTAGVLFFGSMALQAQDEPTFMVTENDTRYELVGWESDIIYNPYSITYFVWEEPVYKKVNVRTRKPVAMSEFDRPPVFDGICLTEKNQLECTNREIQEFVKNSKVDYPDMAQDQGQEGLEYVTVVIDENGKYKGSLQVRSKNEPCRGCSDAAADLVNQMEGRWHPAILDGEKVAVQLTIPIKFKLIEDTY